MLHKLIVEAVHAVVCIAFSELLATIVSEHLNVCPSFLFSVILCSSYETNMGSSKYLQYIIDIFMLVYMDGTIDLYMYMPKLIIILQFSLCLALVRGTL